MKLVTLRDVLGKAKKAAITGASMPTIVVQAIIESAVKTFGNN